MAFNLNSIDNNAKSNGKWVDLEGSRFLIASINSFSFQDRFDALQKPHKRAIDKGTLPPETSNDIMCKALAYAVLLDWEGVEADGVPVEYSRENAVRALKDNDELKSFVVEIASDISNFRAEKEAEDVKS